MLDKVTFLWSLNIVKVCCPDNLPEWKSCQIKVIYSVNFGNLCEIVCTVVYHHYFDTVHILLSNLRSLKLTSFQLWNSCLINEKQVDCLKKKGEFWGFCGPSKSVCDFHPIAKSIYFDCICWTHTHSFKYKKCSQQGNLLGNGQILKQFIIWSLYIKCNQCMKFTYILVMFSQ